MSKICFKCHQENNDDAIFCKNCGEKILDNTSDIYHIAKCPKCGADINAGSQFCSKCGESVSYDQLSAYQRVERTNAEYYNFSEKVNNTGIIIYTVIAIIISIISVLLYAKDLGIFVIFIPILFVIGGVIFYVTGKLKNKVHYLGRDVLNKTVHKDK